MCRAEREFVITKVLGDAMVKLQTQDQPNFVALRNRDVAYCIATTAMASSISFDDLILLGILAAVLLAGACACGVTKLISNLKKGGGGPRKRGYKILHEPSSASQKPRSDANAAVKPPVNLPPTEQQLLAQLLQANKERTTSGRARRRAVRRHTAT